MKAQRNAGRDTRTVKLSPFKPSMGGEPPGRCLSRLPVRGKGRCVPTMPPRALITGSSKPQLRHFFIRRGKIFN